MADLQNDSPEQQKIDGSCGAYSSLLTALFDDEIDDGSARLARAHLERCARCADMWQVWERNRHALQLVPAPMPPVTLLARILLACRLVALARSGNPRRLKRDTASSMVGQFELETQDSAFVETGRWSLMNTPPPPPDLEDAILRLTTRRHEVQQEAVQSETMPRETMLIDIATLIESPRPHPFWNRAGRFAALAVPAALLWIAFVSPRVALTPQNAPELVQPEQLLSTGRSSADSIATAVKNVAPRHTAIAPVAERKTGSGSGAHKSTAAAAPRAAGIGAPRLHAIDSVKRLDDASSTPVATQVDDTAPRSHSRITVSHHVHRDSSSDDSVNVRRDSSDERVERVAVLPRLTSQARPRLATLAALNPALSQKPEITKVRFARSSRLSSPRPSTDSTVEAASDPTTSGLEALQEVHRMGEGRSEAVRQVVEDYRDSVISEIAEPSDDGDDSDPGNS